MVTDQSKGRALRTDVARAYYIERNPDCAHTRRLLEEFEAQTKECAVSGCTNRATHTWSGHPTCDDCGTPGRRK